MAGTHPAPPSAGQKRCPGPTATHTTQPNPLPHHQTPGRKSFRRSKVSLWSGGAPNSTHPTPPTQPPARPPHSSSSPAPADSFPSAPQVLQRTRDVALALQPALSTRPAHTTPVPQLFRPRTAGPSAAQRCRSGPPAGGVPSRSRSSGRRTRRHPGNSSPAGDVIVWWCGPGEFGVWMCVPPSQSRSSENRSRCHPRKQFSS